MFTANVELSPHEEERFAQYIQKEVLSQIYQRLKAAEPYVTRVLQSKVWAQFLSSPEVHELIAGGLRYDLGLKVVEANAVTQQIAELIAEDIHFSVKREADAISVDISLVKNDYSQILSLPEAVFTSARGFKIPWLQWMIFHGDEILVTNFRVKYTNTPASRSGGALMIKGGSWRVPPSFAGVADSNFITRGLTDIEEFVYEELQKFI